MSTTWPVQKKTKQSVLNLKLLILNEIGHKLFHNKNGILITKMSMHLFTVLSVQKLFCAINVDYTERGAGWSLFNKCDIISKLVLNIHILQLQ